MGTFHHAHCLLLQTFQQMDISTRESFDLGTFWHEELSARGIFGTGTFRNEVKYTVAQVPKMSIFLCKVPKYPCVKMFMCQNISCQKVPMLKRSRVVTSICRNIHKTKRCTCRNVPRWNIRAEMTLESCQNLRYQNDRKLLCTYYDRASTGIISFFSCF